MAGQTGDNITSWSNIKTLLNTAGVIKGAALADGAVTSAKLADGAVTTAKVGDKQITKAKLDQDLQDTFTKMELPTLGRDIASYSWEELSQFTHSENITPAQLAYMVGGERTINVSGFGSRVIRCIGVNQDATVESQPNVLTFEFKDILTTRGMNSSDTTANGWGGSAMRSYLEGTVLNALPGDLKAVLKQVKKQYRKTNSGGNSTSNDHLFIMSEKEVFGSSNYGSEGTWYHYYSQSNNNGARVKNYNGGAGYWWLRSVYDSTYFAYVGNDGGLYYDGNASSAGGCVPCFCI